MVKLLSDIELTAHNINYVVNSVLTGVQTCCNKKRRSKRAEIYLRCGGGYDTESTTITDDAGKPRFAFVYHCQMSINGHYIYYRDINLLTPLLRRIGDKIRAEYTDKKGRCPHLIIWCANLAHEYAFCKRQLSAAGITSLFAKAERDPLKIDVCEVIEFRECLGLWGSSLAKVAKTYTATQKLKGDLDYDLPRTEQTPLTTEEYHYCKNDVVILDELSHVAFKRFTDNGLKIPLTQTGILRQKCKNSIKRLDLEYKQNALLMPADEWTYTLFRRYMYAGGLSGTNPKYAGKKILKAKCADITSDYPAQMNHRLFPAGQLIEIKPETVEQYAGKFKIMLICCDMQARTAHSVFSKHKVMNIDNDNFFHGVGQAQDVVLSNGKIFCGKNLCICINNVDYNALYKLYDFDNIKLYRCWIFTQKAAAPAFLRKCLNEDYLTKQALKAAGLSGTKDYTEAKAAVNSYYGMTCQRLYDCLYEYDDESDDIYDCGNVKSYDEQRAHMWLSPYIGYWTTSYARAILMQFIAEFPDLIIQYDTDSLYYLTDTDATHEIHTTPERLAEFEAAIEQYNLRIYNKNARLFKNNAHFEDLGAWEVDKDDYTGFKGLGAKRYLKQDADGSLHPVVAGMVKESFDRYVKHNSLDAFDVFANDMTLDRVISDKLASQYYDGATKLITRDGITKRVPDRDAPVWLEKVTDYLGNTVIVEIGTYHALYDIQFKMKVTSDYVALYQALQQEKALPVEYRYIEKAVRDYIIQYEDNNTYCKVNAAMV
ncbi:DNA polymerase [Ruminococcus sp.]|uniref:DNA polymerase n=1 Tax=Ruminococcus sp. TaxID=41978 RepID=UPI001B430345|nr:DNA polymerase [Ruminococcus sp.]MBP5433136.1 hypothetical protein [Ruminococcus sp.]